MRRRKPKVTVRKFTKLEIQRANDYAVLLWNGISYETGKPITSDRDLLEYFGGEFLKISKRKTNSFSLSPDILHELIIVSLLKPMYRKKKELDYSAFYRFLRTYYSQFNNAISKSVTNDEATEIATDLVMTSAKAIVRRGVSAKAGFRVPFLSRLLFFSSPQLFIFNYANRLAEKRLNYQSRPHYAYPEYATDMLELLRDNWSELSKYNLPTKIKGKPEADIKFAYKTTWWARRVLDIALLIRFNVFTPVPNPKSFLKDAHYKAQAPLKIKKP